MRKLIAICAMLFCGAGAALGQWTLEDSHTTADLRGIDNVGGGVAWASGTNGTVLRTEDAGYLWQPCSVPLGAEKLDFRGVQGFDANTAIVMSSRKGDLSRLYKTTDGCHSWKLVFTNPDAAGFWDAMLLNRNDGDGYILGDPVNGRFALWESFDKGTTWAKQEPQGLEALKDEAAFAASNSALLLHETFGIGFVTGGAQQARVLLMEDDGSFSSRSLPLRAGAQSAGGFSMEARDWCCWIAVGGDFQKPDDRTGTAAYTLDNGKTWQAAKTMPHGYRSAVGYDADTKAWITVGPDGTDLSTDDGRNWRAMHPDASLHDTPDADRNWNALSLPFVVGPHGRVGRLEAMAVKNSK